MADRTNRTAEPEGRRAISVPLAAYRYDMTKNTMRKILKEAGVLIEKGKVHRVLWDDLLRIMEGEIASPAISQPQPAPVDISDVDRAAFTRASQGRGDA
jgi:hypothetical protein